MSIPPTTLLSYMQLGDVSLDYSDMRIDREISLPLLIMDGGASPKCLRQNLEVLGFEISQNLGFQDLEFLGFIIFEVLEF